MAASKKHLHNADYSTCISCIQAGSHEIKRVLIKFMEKIKIHSWKQVENCAVLEPGENNGNCKTVFLLHFTGILL